MHRAAGPALALFLAGCASVAPPRERPAAPPPGAAGAGEVWSESDLPETDAEPPRGARLGGELAEFDLQARLAVRARSYLGRRGPFKAKGQRFGSDCSGFVEAVYAAEGLMLRDLMQRAAPDERSGVAAAWYAARANGRVLGPREWPAPGDLVFWHDTYDRNRNGRADDPFTHLGIVEYVENGTITFLHRGGKGVARGVMTPGRPFEASDVDGRKLNSPLRATTHPVKDGGGLAGALLAGYGRIDPTRVPPEYASRRIDPFYGPGSDRDAFPEGAAVPGATTAARPTPPAAAPAPAPFRTVAATRAPPPPAPFRTVAATRAPPLPAASTPKRTAAPVRSASASKPAGKAAGKAAAKRLAPGKKARAKKASAKKTALARTKPAAVKGRVAAKKAPAAAAQRAETVGAGAESTPSSETRTAEAPKSSSESRRTTGITAPAGSR